MIAFAAPFILFSLLHLWGEKLGNLRIRYMTKPVLMPFLAVFYLFASPDPSLMLIFAMAGGWLGDLCLMVPDKSEKRTWFKLGLVAFLAGHIFYCIAFFQAGDLKALPAWTILPALAILAYGFIVFFKMKDHMGKLFVPITVYIKVIVIMGLCTLTAFGSQAYTAAATALCGAAIFMISDTVNAWNRFVKTIPNERLITMSTYLAGQFLLILGYVMFAT